jgi:two-component system LytT family response regulator
MTTPRPLRVLVVDDEPPARERVRRMLEAFPDFRVAGESTDGTEAVRDILRIRPDLVFLDIQMPGLSGFEVIATVGPDRMPVVVFVTAYDRYALEAFDVHAVDYLLKPYSRERFGEALKSAVREIHRRRHSGKARELGELLAALADDGRVEPRLLVRNAGRVTVVRIADIDWIESAGNYVELHVGVRRHLLRATMSSILRRVASPPFARVHRSRIVNLERVSELRQLRTGDYEILLKDGRRLGMSRRFRSELGSFFAGGP